ARTARDTQSPAAASGVSRCLSPRARAARPQAAARAAARHPRPRAIRDRGGGELLRLGRHLQPGRARACARARRAQGAPRAGHRRAGGRDVEPRLHGAAPSSARGRGASAARVSPGGAARRVAARDEACLVSAPPLTLSLVVPSYNQRERTLRSAAAAAAFLRERYGERAELIVVDDGSRPDEAIEQQALPPGVALVRLP